MIFFRTIQVIPIADATKSIDENGNSVLTFPGGKLKPKAKQNKFDRNTRTLKAAEIIGNRGGDDIKKLLAFIENKETTRKNGMIATNGNEKNKKDKSGKKDGNSPKGEGQLKKSNSLEELKSSSKLEEEKESEQVRRILRQKQQMTKKNSALEIKDNQKNQHRRGERRSWGTEELTYLGDTSVIVPKKDESAAAGKDVTKKPKSVENSIKNPVIQRQKSEEHSLSIVSIESVSTSSETAEFHVVTKKKKAKKRQIFEETRQKPLTDNIETTTGHRSKYHPSQNYANERGDMYLSSFSANDRRKSTSSVPPSDKSDSSDLDSVHSLPIESTIRLRNSATTIESSSPSSTVSNNGTNTTQVSYADIARFSNPDKGLVTNTSTEKWPTVSSVKPAESVVTIVPIETAVIAIPPKSSQRTQRTTASSAHEPIQTDVRASPNPIIDNTATLPITYSQSLTDDKQITLTNHDDHKRLVVAATTSTQTAVVSVGNSVNSGKSHRLVDIIKSSNTGDTLTKSPLQKSKSCDNDNYVNMSIDQYPALEKTVKPQKQYQSVPFVEHGARTLTVSNRSATSNIPLLTSPPNTTNIPHPIVKKAKPTNVITAAKQPQPKLTAATNKKVLTKLDDNQNSDKTVAATTTASVTKKLTKKSKTNAAAMVATNHNRPAVIIMNDNCEYSDKISPLLFGDLTDELRRLLEQDSDEQGNIIIECDAMYANGMPEESIQKDASSSPPPSFAQSKSVQSDEAKGFVTSSPQSDLGYASISNNLDRSTLSNESINNISNVVETSASDMAPPTSNDKICGPSKTSSSNANLVSSLFKNNSKNSSTSVSNSDDSRLDISQSCAKSAVNRNAEGVFVDPSIVFAVAACSADVSDAIANSSQINAKNISSEKQAMLRYVAPPKLDTAVNYNHEKIVNFVGMGKLHAMFIFVLTKLFLVLIFAEIN